MESDLPPSYSDVTNIPPSYSEVANTNIPSSYSKVVNTNIPHSYTEVINPSPSAPPILSHSSQGPGAVTWNRSSGSIHALYPGEFVNTLQPQPASTSVFIRFKK